LECASISLPSKIKHQNHTRINLAQNKKKKQARGSDFGFPQLLPLSLPAFACAWCLFGIPAVVGMDLVLFTYYLTVDTSATARIVYYAK
jgi:hypothetical protein